MQAATSLAATRPRTVRRAGTLLLGVALAALAVQLPIFDRWLVVLDEGYVLELADEVNRGKVLYRDVYVDAPFPGAFYLLAAWFRVFGTSIWASRVLMVVAFIAFAVAAVSIGRTLLSRWGVVGLAAALLGYRIWAFPHWHIVSYSSLAVTALTAAVALVARHLRTCTSHTLLVAGVLAGAGILCKQDYGLGVSGAVGLFLLVRPWLARRPATTVPVPAGALGAALVFAAGAGLVLLPAAAYFAAAGALPELIQQAILRPLRAATAFGYTRLPPLRPLLGQDPVLRDQIGSYFPAILLTLRWNAIAYSHLYLRTAVWDVGLKLVYYAPIVLWATAAVAWSTGAVRRSRARAATGEDEARLLVLAWAGGFLLAFSPPRDWVHVMMIYPPALVIGGALLAQAFGRTPAYVRRAAAAVVGVLLAGLVAVSLGLALDLRRRLDSRLDEARAGVWVDDHHGPILRDVLAYVAEHAPPGEPVPVYPLQPMITFLADRESVAGFHVIWPVQDPERDAKIIAELERRRVPLVVYSLSQYAHIGNFRQNAPRLFDYLVDRYEIAHVFTREAFGPLYLALRRRPGDGPPGAPMYDVPADWPGDGVVRPARWPFTTVMAERVTPPGTPALARFAIPVPPGRPLLAFAYGVNPDRWLDAPSGPYTFTVSAEDEHGTSLGELFAATLDPYARLEDRRWAEAQVDLSPWAGRRLTLAFAITAKRLPPDPTDVAGWANPRIVP